MGSAFSMASSPFPPTDALAAQTVHRALYHRIPLQKRPMESQTFDREYLDRLAAGDPPTSNHFIRYFTKILLIKLRAKMRSPSEAEDAAQETLYRVLRYVASHRGIDRPEALGAFVNSVSEHVVLEAFREGGRFQQVPESVPEPIERAFNAEVTCISDERKQLVRRQLLKLRQRDRVVLERVFLLEQDKDAICADLNIDRNYLRVQVHRALARFRAILEGEKPASRASNAKKASAI
jgi:RNA polymerase sigma-70 factor (ECF subfamily)